MICIFNMHARRVFNSQTQKKLTENRALYVKKHPERDQVIDGTKQYGKALKTILTNHVKEEQTRDVANFEEVLDDIEDCEADIDQVRLCCTSR